MGQCGLPLKTKQCMHLNNKRCPVGAGFGTAQSAQWWHQAGGPNSRPLHLWLLNQVTATGSPRLCALAKLLVLNFPR